VAYRRFPPPWTVEELDACFVGDGQCRAKLAASQRKWVLVMALADMDWTEISIAFAQCRPHNLGAALVSFFYCALDLLPQADVDGTCNRLSLSRHRLS
jgi:hypothetical protein